jgi:hypothetical protein
MSSRGLHSWCYPASKVEYAHRTASHFKDFGVLAVIAAIGPACIYLNGDETAGNATLLASENRLMMATVVSSAMSFVYIIGGYIMPAPTKEENRWHIVGGALGSNAFLTVQILSLQTVHLFLSLCIEAGLVFCSSPNGCSDHTANHVQAMARYVYGSVVFVSACGTVLTILFMKLCW